MRRFLSQSWFLMVLCASIAVGVLLADSLSPFAHGISKEWVIGLVMLATSLGSDFRQLTKGRGAWLAVALAIAINAAVAPPLGWLFGRLLEPSLAQGLIVAMALPCTVASAIVWTRRGGGNDAATAIVTLVTNFACFLVLPFWTGLLVSDAADATPARLVSKLLLCVAAPMFVAQVLRLAKPIAAMADRAKAGLSLFAQAGVLLLAFIAAVNAGAAMRSGQHAPTVGDWAALVAVVAGLHAALLLLGWLVGSALHLASADKLTVVIAGSQKTMAVGLGVALHFGPMALFPLVAYHFTQLIIDTLVVDIWRRRNTSQSTG